MFRLKLMRVCSGPLVLLLISTAAGADPAALMSPFRTWKDSSGKFAVTAAVEKIEGGEVFLRLKDNGTTVPVPLNRLSPADQAYAKGLMDTGEAMTEAPADDFAATTVVLRRDLGSVKTSTEAGVLIFADEKFGHLRCFGRMRFSEPAELPAQTPGIGSSTAPSSPQSEAELAELGFKIPPNGFDTWRATFHYGSSGEFFKMVHPGPARNHLAEKLGAVPLGKLPTPLLSRKTALPVAGNEVKIVGIALQPRSNSPPHIGRATCKAKVLPMKGDAADLLEFEIEGYGLPGINAGVVLDGQDHVLGIVLHPATGRYGSRSRDIWKVTSVRSLQRSIAPTLEEGYRASVIYAEGWSGTGVSLDFDVRVWDRLSRAGKMALLVKRHSAPLPAATQTGADNWAPILPEMTVVPLAYPDQRQSSSQPILLAKWRDSQGVDGQEPIHYAAQLQWTDAVGKVRQTRPQLLTPRLCSREAWPKMQVALGPLMARQATPMPDGTICLTPESTRGWPGTTPFITDLGTAGPKATSPGTELENQVLDVGKFACRVHRADYDQEFITAPIWSRDGAAFFVLSKDGLLRKVAKSDFRVLRSVQLIEPQGASSNQQRTTVNMFPSSEGPIAMVADGDSAKFWVLDKETLEVKRGLGMPATWIPTSSDSPIIYVPNDYGLTIVDVSTGKVLRHLGEREAIGPDKERSPRTSRGTRRGTLAVTPDGRCLTHTARGGFGVRENFSAVFHIDKDQLTFNSELVAATPYDATHERNLVQTLARMVRSAAQEQNSETRNPARDLSAGGPRSAAISPNGKEFVMVSYQFLIYAPQLPEIKDQE